MQSVGDYLGQALKQLRSERGWSLDRAAQACGVSKAMLGQIERAESSPTLATLWKIAGGFKVPLSAFIAAPPNELEVRQAEQLRQRPTSDAMLVAPLFPFDPRYGFELLELTLPAAYERLSEPHESGVTEHVTVIQGEVELLVNGCWQRLKQGAAVRFAADAAHGYRNPGSDPAVIHNLICYPALQSR
ncbi:helix-turn-helix domain-containing protein [Halopseudomonas sp.]|uniref:helix-turn-helix domain-containing protein n=1 Tax=Halopseudomonas sp. TaxID=2901191 RepID=UPI0030033C58